MDNAASVLTDYVLAKLPAETAATRAKMYRALANVAAPEDCKRLLSLATECEAIDSAHQQLSFDFQQRARGRSAHPFSGAE